MAVVQAGNAQLQIDTNATHYAYSLFAFALLLAESLSLVGFLLQFSSRIAKMRPIGNESVLMQFVHEWTGHFQC